MAKDKTMLVKYTYSIDFLESYFNILFCFEDVVVTANQPLVAIAKPNILKKRPSHCHIPKMVDMVLGFDEGVPVVDDGIIMFSNILEYSPSNQIAIFVSKPQDIHMTEVRVRYHPNLSQRCTLPFLLLQVGPTRLVLVYLFFG